MPGMDEILNDEITLSVKKDAALILFDLLFDLKAESKLTLDDVQRDTAEVCALVVLHGALESTLVESFDPEYGNLLESAKARLRAKFGVTN